MKKIFLILLLFIVNVWCIDKFSIIKSKDNDVCIPVLNILNNDLTYNKKVDLKQHEEFNWFKWYALKENFQDSFYVAHLDINNDEKIEAIFLHKYQWHYYDIEDISVMELEDAKILEVDYSNKKLIEAAKKVLTRVTNGFGIYNFKNDENILMSSKKVDRIYFTELYPMKLKNKFYIAIFGNVESLKEFKIPLGARDMQNNGNMVVIAMYNKGNKRNDICLLKRNQNRISEGLK